MSLQRLDLLVRMAREQTGNRNTNGVDNSGIPQREFVRYANDAQMRIYNKLLQERSTLYVKEAFLDAVAGQASYTLPTSDIFLSHNLVKIDYSPNGNPISYAPLDQRTPRQEISVRGYPESYFLRDGAMVVTPMPSSNVTNAFRLNYQYIIPDLDIRRGQISAVSIAGQALTSITLSATSGQLLLQEYSDDLSNGWVDFISVVDSNGVIKANNIPVTSYNPTTRVISCATTLAAGQTVATTNYVLFGKNATTHSSLPAVAERYLVQYMALMIQLRDSNQESTSSQQVLGAMEQEILDAIAELEEDIFSIPIVEWSYLNYDESI